MKKELIKLTSFNFPIEAEIFKSYLNSYDIECFIFGENTTNLEPVPFNQISIMINSEDSEKALDLYTKYSQ